MPRIESKSEDSSAQESSLIAKLMPILFGLIAGMLIMLLIVYFVPPESRQNDMQTSTSQTKPISNEIPSLGSNEIGSTNGSMGQVEITSTTVSGYPVVTSGAPRAVDYSGRAAGQSDTDSLKSSLPTSPALANPCVDPPSSKSQSYRYAQR